MSFGSIYKNRIFGQGLHFEGLLNVIDLSLFQLPPRHIIKVLEYPLGIQSTITLKLRMSTVAYMSLDNSSQRTSMLSQFKGTIGFQYLCDVYSSKLYKVC